MGEIKEPHRSFTLKFRHVCGRVTVIQKEDNYLAFIVFPRAYTATPPNFHHALPRIVATNISYACETAVMEFKAYYAALDNPIRTVEKFNFYVQRIRFRTAIERQIGDFKGSFVITRQFYGISENVDGVKYSKTLYDNRERTSCFRALFLMNFDKVFGPLVQLGFNHKLIQRLLLKHNKVKAHQLRIYDDGLFIDDLEKHPERLANHVADQREDFHIALGWEKVRRVMANGL